MNTSVRKQNSKIKKIWIPLVIVLLIALGSFGYFYWTQKTAAAAATTTTTYKTTKVKQGTITISTSGSGTLTASQESALSFSTTGTVAKVNVQVADVVTKGQELAQLDNLVELQASVDSAQQNLITAQQDLATLKKNASTNLANAQITLIDAKKAVIDAKSGVVQKGWQRCDDTTTEAYYYKYTHAKAYLDTLGDGGGNRDYYLKILVPAKNTVAQAQAAWEYCAGYTDYEITSSQATLSLDQAQVQLAQDTLDTLKANNGIDPLALATAENKVTSAQIALDSAKKTLDNATINAPYSGTILSVSGTVGDVITDTTTFITIADLQHPLVSFSVDETDLSKVDVGEQATITFDAIPDETFTGKVTRINPALETSGGYQVVTGLIELDLSQTKSSARLLKSLTGTVTLVQATAENVLLVPVQALHDLGDGTYSVFVVGTNNQLQARTVEVGLEDAASAEIKSGLALGDTVSTGTIQTK